MNFAIPLCQGKDTLSAENSLAWARIYKAIEEQISLSAFLISNENHVDVMNCESNVASHQQLYDIL